MRAFAVSRLAAMLSVIVTSWPATANTCAMPCPIRPAPITAMRALLMPRTRCHLPLKGGGRRAKRGGWGSMRAHGSMIPPRIAFGDPTLPFQGRVKRGCRAVVRARMSARRIAAVGVEDVAGVEVRCLGGEEEKRPGEV